MKRFLISLAVSACITLAGMFVNYRTFQQTHYLKWSVKMPGGECMLERGFGLSSFHTYPMTQEGTAAHSLSFDPLSLIVSLAVITAAVYLILWVFQTVRKTKNA